MSMPQSVRLQQKLQKNFYNRSHPEYLDYTKNIPYASYVINKMQQEHVSLSGTVLEIGAGQGRFTFALAQQVKSLIATDFSKKEVRQLRANCTQLNIHNVSPQVVDVLSLQKHFPANTFDDVVGFFVLHHIPQVVYTKVVEQLLSVLKRKGTITLIEPNNWYPFHLVEMILMPEMEWSIEKQIYSKYMNTFVTVCKNNKLTIKSQNTFGFFPPFVINICPWLTIIDSVIEKIPILNKVLCPFVIISVSKR